MIKKIVSFFKILNSNSNPAEVANAVCLGVMLGLIPKNNLLWYLIFVFFLFVRINKTAYFLITLLVSLIAPLTDSFFDVFGYKILTTPAFTPAFSKLLDIPFVAFTKFNCTIVCGSVVFSLLIYVPLFIICMIFIKFWRKTVTAAWNNSKIGQFFYKLPLVNKFREAAMDLV